MEAGDRHSLDALDAQRVLANVSAGLFGAQLAPAQVGRFVLLDKLGSGGMGVVYSAFDPRLDRRVAIKVLARAPDEARAQDSARLLREARALAMVSHPNVVTVYEVGTIDDRVFLAMELVSGQPLDRWLAEPRPWRELVDVFSRAGRGLAAAHAQGVVHRDFKPSNVMLADDGRVIVLDFGLARSERAPRSTATEPRTEPATEAPLEAALTETHAIVGTPRYMSPEQFDGGAVDSRSDQFSWCVAMFEALYGERPFEGDTVAALAAAVRAGEVRSPEASAQVPAWLGAVVRRGLSLDPEQRFASMDALLLALAGPRRSWWRRPGSWVGLASVGALGLAWQWPAPAPEPCTGSEAQVREVWNDAREQAVRVAFEGVALPYAEDARRGATQALDDYARQWAQAHHEACAATRVHATQSEAVLDRRMLCLQERLESLDAIAELLTQADADVVRHAVSASWELPELGPCADPRALQAEGPPPSPAALERRAGWRRTIARAVAKRDAGKHEAARSELAALMADAALDEDLRVRAEAGIELGILHEKAGEHETAAALVERALWDAVADSDLGLQARAATQLVTIVGWQLREAEAGHEWSRMARAVLARMDDPPAQISILEGALGNLRYSEGDYAAAVEHKTRALELRERLRGADDPRLATLHSDLGLFLGHEGDPAASLAHHRRAVALRERALGATHPDTAMSYNGLAGQLRHMGQLGESLEYYERARALWIDAFGPDHTKVAMVDNNMANTLAISERGLEAIPHYRQAIRIWMTAPESHASRIAHARSNLGMVLVQLGRTEEGLPELAEPLRLHTAKLGADHPDTTPVRINLSIAQHALGHPEPALEHAQQAVRLVLQARRREHELFAQAKVAEGETLAELGRLDEAIVAVEESARVFQTTQVSIAERADSYFLLAKLLRTRGTAADELAARTWAQEALAQLQGDERPQTERIAALTKWLEQAEH